jgi:hypothetical protein
MSTKRDTSSANDLPRWYRGPDTPMRVIRRFARGRRALRPRQGTPGRRDGPAARGGVPSAEGAAAGGRIELLAPKRTADSFVDVEARVRSPNYDKELKPTEYVAQEMKGIPVRQKP